MKIPKIETLLIFVFFGCVAMWAISKCGNKRSTLVRGVTTQNEEREDRPPRRDTIALPAPRPSVQQPAVNTQRPTVQAPAPAVSSPTATAPVSVAKPTRTPPPIAAAPVTPAPQKYATLYVTIDGLKMRKTPGLKGELVTKLELYEPVLFLNQKSEKTEEISLGYEKVTDYWVKVRTQSGKEGWVFGAGVYYYKMKRKGVKD
ncbi:MAG: SH3 domain-containing protein [Saprospiraceae bacterium]